MNDTIIIIDYGSQYTQLIARRIREFNVHSIILPYDCEQKTIDKYNAYMKVVDVDWEKVAQNVESEFQKERDSVFLDQTIIYTLNS